ncbi:hypothetical protein CONCODRAFT_121341 [Conidiobolus coronatus NRRL 28638]|uniref:Transcription factor domain-containing protein n=1 Tax=Conidiobolus coronatus (strain ATCC 28846 / CBS 209.66 / NRRL 28638) TaxID=796925 RepID=A0A137NW95_CONC2|nr:hypothetical protein CONCODRAFT_121341 [Conidiobolus coronatus NRRL 28638]|eukprot:KXN67042.1 hypothetical protein CONCODRAFT_121341 [Conidiobolus coronatus NRRL 28638]
MLKNSLELDNLRRFILGQFDSERTTLDEGRVTQIIETLPPCDIKLIDRLIANRLNVRLQYAFESPIYKGPAMDVTSINHSNNPTNAILSQKLLKIDDKLQPLESHLLRLFFKYFNPYYTLVHPNYFYHRLKVHWQDFNFQALLAIILCCSTSYLAIEPFDYALNSSKLAEFYFERSLTLLTFVNPHDPSYYPTRIQICLLIIYNDYGSIPQNYSEAIRLSKELNWHIDYSMDKEFIINTRPRGDDMVEIFNWEENLVIWLGLNFHATTVLMAKFPLQGLKLEVQLPDLHSALEALFHRPNTSGWIASLEAGLIYYLYEGHYIFERMRIYNHLMLTQFGAGRLPDERQLTELNSIKYSLANWRLKFTRFADKCYFKQNELALLTLLHLYYYKTLLMILMPHLPSTSEQLLIPQYQTIWREFLLSSIAVSLLMASQGIWIIIFASGTKNFILSIALSGLKLCNHHLLALNPSTLTSDLRLMKELTDLILPSLVVQLTKNFSFAFQKTISEELAEKRGFLFWLNLRTDRYLEESAKANDNGATNHENARELDERKSTKRTNSGSSTGSGGGNNRPPKLFNQSNSTILN